MKMRSFFKAILDKYLNKSKELLNKDGRPVVKNLHEPAKVIYMYKTRAAALKK
jgi:hypothetical protein